MILVSLHTNFIIITVAPLVCKSLSRIHSRQLIQRMLYSNKAAVARLTLADEATGKGAG